MCVCVCVSVARRGGGHLCSAVPVLGAATDARVGRPHHARLSAGLSDGRVRVPGAAGHLQRHPLRGRRVQGTGLTYISGRIVLPV